MQVDSREGTYLFIGNKYFLYTLAVRIFNFNAISGKQANEPDGKITVACNIGVADTVPTFYCHCHPLSFGTPCWLAPGADRPYRRHCIYSVFHMIPRKKVLGNSEEWLVLHEKVLLFLQRRVKIFIFFVANHGFQSSQRFLTLEVSIRRFLWARRLTTAHQNQMLWRCGQMLSSFDLTITIRSYALCNFVKKQKIIKKLSSEAELSVE